MPATPLNASVVLKETVTFDRYHPLSPRSPVRVSVVAGGVRSMRMAIDWVDARRPAPVVAENSRGWTPSSRTTDAHKPVQVPPSTRQLTLAMPLPGSLAWTENATVEMYQPPWPAVPVRMASVTGGVVSMGIDSERIGSGIPSRSVAN